MIDPKLINENLALARIGLMDGRSARVFEEMLATFPEDINESQAEKIDAFGMAWNRLPRNVKFRILTMAHRFSKNLFQCIQMDSPIRWHDFNNAQRGVIIRVTTDMLIDSVTLFSDKLTIEEYKKGLISGIRAALEKEASESGLIDTIKGIA